MTIDNYTDRLSDAVLYELGWARCVASEHYNAGAHDEELKLELNHGHKYFNIPLKAVAYSEASDDVLFQRLNNPDQFVVLHLTWSMKKEHGECPTIEWEGRLKEFLEDCV